jgi:hypothetical protein
MFQEREDVSETQRFKDEKIPMEDRRCKRHRHKIIMDWIDIDPDRSQAIWYCEKCGLTSEVYNKDKTPLLECVSPLGCRKNLLDTERENRLKRENNRKGKF